MAPSGIMVNWALSSLKPSAIQQMTDDLIRQTKAVYDKIGALPLADVSVENCLQV